MLRAILIWTALLLCVAVPLAAAATSPLLAWRQPVYIAAGFAGVVAMALLLLQPLLAAGYLPGLSERSRRRIHRWTGILLVGCIVGHVVGLWVTSPPDMIDALLFVSPTPFSAWGVIAMWALFGAALLAACRWRLNLRFRVWRLVHTSLATITIVGSIGHALLIQGTMEDVSKTVLCFIVLLVTAKALFDLRVWSIARRRDSSQR